MLVFQQVNIALSENNDVDVQGFQYGTEFFCGEIPVINLENTLLNFQQV